MSTHFFPLKAENCAFSTLSMLEFLLKMVYENPHEATIRLDGQF